MNKAELKDQLIKGVEKMLGQPCKEVYFEQALPHQAGSRVKLVVKDRPSEELIDSLEDLPHILHPMWTMATDTPGILLMTDVEMHE